MDPMVCPSCNSQDIKGYGYEEGRIFLCPSCKLQWSEYSDYFKKPANPRILQPCALKDINNYYMDPGSISSAAQYPPYKSFFEFLKAKKTQHCLRILDIGCGNGVFLRECLRRGHDAIGIEANESLRDVISKEIIGRVIFSPVEKVEDFGEPFDVITFWDSFEHITGGFDLLDSLRPHLKEDGVIYLRVNNNRDILNLLTLLTLSLFPAAGKKLLKICFGFPDHIWNFSKAGMHNLLAKRNWKVISCRFSETPISRFTRNPLLAGVILLGYLCNRAIRGGKIGEYYIAVSALTGF